jgi:hypothetical protein
MVDETPLEYIAQKTRAVRLDSVTARRTKISERVGEHLMAPPAAEAASGLLECKQRGTSDRDK